MDTCSSGRPWQTTRAGRRRARKEGTTERRNDGRTQGRKDARTKEGRKKESRRERETKPGLFLAGGPLRYSPLFRRRRERDGKRSERGGKRGKDLERDKKREAHAWSSVQAYKSSFGQRWGPLRGALMVHRCMLAEGPTSCSQNEHQLVGQIFCCSRCSFQAVAGSRPTACNIGKAVFEGRSHHKPRQSRSVTSPAYCRRCTKAGTGSLRAPMGRWWDAGCCVAKVTWTGLQRLLGLKKLCAQLLAGALPDWDLKRTEVEHLYAREVSPRSGTWDC